MIRNNYESIFYFEGVQTYQSPGATARFMYYYYTHLTCVIAILGHILKGKGTLFFTYFIYELRKCDVTDDMPKEKKIVKKEKERKKMIKHLILLLKEG
jgi:hypothetical protein